MSNWRERVEDESGFDAVTALVAGYYHYVALAFLVGFAFWNRTRNWSRYVVDGQILFRGNDPWYHYRMTSYVVENFPETMPFDPWTNFAVGTSNSQFGTIYDQLVALGALVLGLGSPDEGLVKLVGLFAPAVFGVAIAIPIYVMGRRLGGRFGGVVGVAILAFASDRLLSLSVAGFFDHHVAEALFQALAVLGVMVAVRVSETDKPVWELLADREFGVLRRPLAWGAIAGVGIGLYLWVWPPGVFLYGVLGTFFVLHLSFEYLRGRSPEHAAFVGAVALSTAGVMQLAAVRSIDISATGRTLLQPGLGFVVAGGCVFMAWLARKWDARELPALGYPAAVVGTIAAAVGVMALATPDLFGFFLNNVLRVFGFLSPATGTAATVGEVQSLPFDALFGYYGFAVVTAAAGAGILLVKQYLDEDPRGEHLLVVLWTAFMLSAALTQARFGYYLTVPVAALNATFVGYLMGLVGTPRESLSVEPYQVMAVLAILLVVIAPMFVFASPIAAAGGAQSPGGIAGWDSSLRWLSENSPEEGQFGTGNASEIEYYGTVPRTDDYDYPEGAYGVMSWWDYGHWITAHGERIPIANPFQQGSAEAAEYLLSQSEDESLSVLGSIDEEDATTRFVMVDWKMMETESLQPVRGKFFAPPTFDDDSNKSTYYSRIVDTNRLQEGAGLYAATLAIRHKQAYYNTTLNRLYRYHGSAQEPSPVVLDWSGAERKLGGSGSATSTAAPNQGTALKTFPNMTAARQFVAEDGTAQIGGIGPHPSQRVPAMDHYRLVHMSELTGFQGQLRQSFRRTVQLSGLGQQLQEEGVNQSRIQQQAIQFLYPNTPSWTKTFERVEGATIQGTGPAETTLRIRVPMQPRNGVPFFYRKQVTTDEQGEFSTTVPYSTEGYDAVGEGYTNVSVRASGPYTITAGLSPTDEGALTRWSGTVNVTERQVVGLDDAPATVELTEESVGSVQSGSEGGGTNETGGELTGKLTGVGDLGTDPGSGR